MKSVTQTWHAEAIVLAASGLIEVKAGHARKSHGVPEFSQSKSATDAEYELIIANEHESSCAGPMNKDFAEQVGFATKVQC